MHCSKGTISTYQCQERFRISSYLRKKEVLPGIYNFPGKRLKYFGSNSLKVSVVFDKTF